MRGSPQCVWCSGGDRSTQSTVNVKVHAIVFVIFLTISTMYPSHRQQHCNQRKCQISINCCQKIELFSSFSILFYSCNISLSQAPGMLYQVLR